MAPIRLEMRAMGALFFLIVCVAGQNAGVIVTGGPVGGRTGASPRAFLVC